MERPEDASKRMDNLKHRFAKVVVKLVDNYLWRVEAVIVVKGALTNIDPIFN